VADLGRVASIRETMASVAEARLREAENVVRELEREDDALVRQIAETRAEIAQRKSLVVAHIHQANRYVEIVEKRRAFLAQQIEKAKQIVLERQREWIEARREHRIIERVQERRLQEWQRAKDIELQKAADEAFIAKLVRARK
jgi:flagellar export protein FliJ